MSGSKQFRVRMGAFTFVELLVATAVSSMILAGLMIGSTSLQRSLEASRYSMILQNDQLRVNDYLTRDLHNASTVTIENNGRKLIVTVPESASSIVSLKHDEALKTLLATVRPQIDPKVVTYYTEGKSFIRAVDGVVSVIGGELTDFNAARAGSVVTLTYELSLTPTSSRSRAVVEATRQYTKVTTCVTLRNIMQ